MRELLLALIKYLENDKHEIILKSKVSIFLKNQK